MKTNEDYSKRVNKVIEYIDNNLDQNLDLKTLASVSNFSEYHFHRIFKAFQNETLASYITRMRIETASRLLRYSHLPIESIAYNVGYSMPSSLSKAFKQLYGISPSEYKINQKNIIIMKKEKINPDVQLNAPKIAELEKKNIIYIRLTGKYQELDFSGAYNELWNFVQKQNILWSGTEFIAVYIDDPEITESEKLRTDVCVTIQNQVSTEGRIKVGEISRGKYAIFLYKGPYHNLESVYSKIFCEWLPQSNYELANKPSFEKYVNDPSNTKPEDLETEIYIPLK